MKRVFCLFPLLLALTSCIPVAVFTGALVAGSIVYDQRSIQTQLSDNDINVLAQERLNADPLVSNHSNILIATYNGVILMVGQAQTPKVRNEAYKIISTIPNVRKVYNEVNLSGSVSDLATVNDTWLSNKVRTSLLTESRLSSAGIKVVTEAGTVYLMGDVTQAQGKIASDIARKIDGVQEVVTVFQYR